MTTPAAERLYEAQHQLEWEGRPIAVFNPHNKPIAELPAIYGFNNGGSPGWYSAVLLAEDGAELGGHLCSAEGYMPHDLGVLEGARPDRHEGFRKHYPDGYRMEFIGSKDVMTHPGLDAAVKRNQERARNMPPDPEASDKRIPVTITGYLTHAWSRDDGTSIEFAVDVESVERRP